jgi:hypothetical protein
MRVFGSIQTSFWANPEVQLLSDQGKLLLTYLFTGPHSNMIGCFRLPAGYITEDLSWNIQKVKTAFTELSKMVFLTRENSSGWLTIHNFLKWNPVQNPKQAKGVQKLFDIVPADSVVLIPLIDGLLNFGKYLDEGFANRLHTLKNSQQTQSNDDAADKDNNNDQDNNTDQKEISSLREEVLTQNKQPKAVGNQLTCPHEKIVDLYHEILPMCPKILVWNKARRSYLKQRWMENTKHQTLEWWETYFNHVKQSQFLTGNVLGRDGKPPFVADLEWLVRPNNFVKVIEGKYHGVCV